MPSSWEGLVSPDEFVQGPGHAEEAIVNSLAEDEVIGFGGTSRNICWDICHALLDQPGMKFGGAGYMGGNPDKSPFSTFWAEGW
jgi:hypothetical protein